MLHERLNNAKLYWVYDQELACQLDPKSETFKTLMSSGHVDIIQFRAKKLDEMEFTEWVSGLLPHIDRSTTLTFSNDFVQPVIDLNLDGLHGGDKDLPITTTRQILGNSKLIGATARSVERALSESAQADYLGVGTVFETSTKQGLIAQGPQFIKKIHDLVNCPVFPIGGIDETNINILQQQSGIGRAAIASCLLKASDPVKYASYMKGILQN